MMIKYWEAVNRALGDALEIDQRVILFGEDVAEAGGVFGATKGLKERFGPERVRDTPISEAASVGMAVGASMTGYRPIVEVLFMDFLCLVMDQLVNQAAKVSYMSGGTFRAPMVVRTICGGGRGSGLQHSQNFEGWLANVPGLKVVWPSNAADAYGLLRTAVDDDDPVVVIESLRLWTTRQDVVELVKVPIGEAAIRTTGADLTLVTWGGAVQRAIAAVSLCKEHNIDVEVIDLRSISPLDENTVLTSLAKTGRMVIVEDGPGHVSVGTRIASLAAGPGFYSLKSPVLHISSPFAPVPFTPILEDAYYPSSELIAETIVSNMGVLA